MAAVASPRQSSSVRPNRNTMQVDEFDDVPVLLRLPNLRPDQPQSAPEPGKAPASQPQKEDAERSREAAGNPAGSKNTRAASSTRSTTPATASTGSKVLSLLWRIGIVAAALALIVLAYRIINGPPVPQHAEGLSEPSIPVADLEPPSVEMAEPEKFSPPPKIVTPKLAVPEDLSQEGSHMADASDEAFPANDTDLPDTHGGLQPHQDASDNEWADTYRTGGSSYDELTSQSPADLEGPQRDVDAGTNWAATEQPMTDEGRYRETDRSFTDPGSETVAGYPQSDPATWRTADQWHQASDEAAWEEEAAPPWHEAGRSAARLRSQIEQPPLNRDRLR